MPEFTRRWNNFSGEVGVTPVTQVPEAPYVTSGTSLQGTLSEKTCSRPDPDAFSDNLLSRLQAGTRWLTAQHKAWLDDKKDAAGDERFSVALAAWDEMERSLRMVYNYEGCIFGVDQRCPQDALVTCDGCLG